jgi:N-acylglucosamine 2-epimerase
MSISKPNLETLQYLRNQYRDELLGNVIPFWQKNSPDREFGGYFNCLDSDGSVYDTRKNVWLQGREAWMFSKLYNAVEKRPEWLEMATLGIDFLQKHAIEPNGRMYFALNREGRPMHQQRKIFSECFYIMALSEYARATGEQQYADEAKRMFALVWEWSKDLTKVGRPSFDGNPPSQPLAVPMILLNLIEEVTGDDWQEMRTEIDDCIRRMLLHVHHDRKIVFENVSPDGSFINSIEGRQLNPGHAIEAGWFLQHWAQKLGRKDLEEIAIKVIRWSFDLGWDKEHGGIFYFLDSEGHSPNELEWPLKLWWPHTEAMYALLQNYSITGLDEDWDRFIRCHEYTWSHFPDSVHGEWFGYLDRFGNVSQRFKGGPYKGCFHVPRGLWLTWRLLENLIQKVQA